MQRRHLRARESLAAVCKCWVPVMPLRRPSSPALISACLPQLSEHTAPAYLHRLGHVLQLLSGLGMAAAGLSTLAAGQKQRRTGTTLPGTWGAFQPSCCSVLLCVLLRQLVPEEAYTAVLSHAGCGSCCPCSSHLAASSSTSFRSLLYWHSRPANRAACRCAQNDTAVSATLSTTSRN